MHKLIYSLLPFFQYYLLNVAELLVDKICIALLFTLLYYKLQQLYINTHIIALLFIGLGRHIKLSGCMVVWGEGRGVRCSGVNWFLVVIGQEVFLPCASIFFLKKGQSTMYSNLYHLKRNQAKLLDHGYNPKFFVFSK